MTAYSQGNALVLAMLYMSHILRSSGHRMRVSAMTLGAWLERRRSARLARRALAVMSERELRDVGLARYDIERAWPYVSEIRPFRID